MDKFAFSEGNSPLMVSMPHVGLHIPDDVANGMTDLALIRLDTDWHIDRLYDFLGHLGASLIAATHSRYVIDLNRAPDGSSLYPGRPTTGLCPTCTSDGESLYRQGAEPGQEEIARRIAIYWKPYHERLAAELSRIRDLHGYALLWEAHSIRSVIPRLFEGRLPDFNIGTADDASCDPALTRQVVAAAESSADYSIVVNGRFKGGYITRQYGRPADGVHAIQLELSQRTYMEEAYPFTFREDRAEKLRPVLRGMIETLLSASERLR